MFTEIKTKDDLRALKKEFTKVQNKLSKKVNELSYEFRDVAQEAYDDYPYEDRSELGVAVSNFTYVHPFVNGLVKLPAYLETIKQVHPDLYAPASKFYEQVKPDIEHVLALTQHITDGAAYLKGTTPQQFLTNAAKNKDLSDVKRKAFSAFALTLKGWKESKVNKDTLIINGVKVGETAMVGVMIGAGVRVHAMRVSIGTHEDKPVIMIRNGTQWNRSSLVILDLLEHIPADVMSDRR